ncbi:MAG: hypothetical protein RLZZ09_2794 [Pseudomonadota bacterium]
MSETTPTVNSDAETAISRSPLEAAVVAYLDELGWNYERRPSKTGDKVSLITHVNLDTARVRYCLDIVPSRHGFGIFAYAPFDIPESRRHEVMLYSTRINHRIYLSKIEMDLEDGELQVVSTAIVEDAELSQAMIGIMMRNVHSVMDTYLPGILAIIHGQRTADEAWRAVLAGEVTDDVHQELDESSPIEDAH